MALLEVRVACRVFVVVEIRESQLVALASRQRLIVREENVEHFHYRLVRTTPINLEHQIVESSYVLHPAASKHVGLLYVLVAFHAKLLHSFQVFDQFCLIVPNVVRQDLRLLRFPLSSWTQRSAVHAQHFRGWLVRIAAHAPTNELYPFYCRLFFLNFFRLLVDLRFRLFFWLSMFVRLIIVCFS